MSERTRKGGRGRGRRHRRPQHQQQQEALVASAQRALAGGLPLLKDEACALAHHQLAEREVEDWACGKEAAKDMGWQGHPLDSMLHSYESAVKSHHPDEQFVAFREFAASHLLLCLLLFVGGNAGGRPEAAMLAAAVMAAAA